MASGKSRSGFTLIETAFAMFLIFTVLGALVFTLKQASDVRSNLKNMGELSELVHSLNLLRADVAAQLEIVEPSAGSSGPSLRLRRMDPTLLLRDRINDDPLDEDLDPFEDSERSEVEYFLDEGLLRRRITAAKGTTTSERLLPLESLRFTYEEAPDILSCQMTVKNSRRSKEHTVKVSLR